MHSVSYVPSIAMIFLTIVFFIVVVGLGMLVGKNDKRFSLMILLCIPFVAIFVYFRSQVGNHHSYVSVVEQTRTEPLIDQTEAEAAKQTAIQTRIEILEKELEAELKQDSKLSETDQKSKKPKPSPGDAAVAEKKEKEATSKQLEETKQILEKAKQELKREKEKSLSQPRWMYSITLLDKKTLEIYLANQNDFPNRFVVSSGRFTTIGEAQSDAERLAKTAIKSKIIRQVGQSQISIDDKQLRPLISKTYNEQLQVKILDGKSTTMHRQHLLIDMSPENMTALFPNMRKTIVEKRIYTTAGGVLGIMLMSGLLSVVLSRCKE